MLRFLKSLAFAAGFGDKKGDLLFDLLAFALRATDFYLVVFRNALLQ
jgi:hypothetical protein